MFTDFRSFVFFIISTFIKPIMGLIVALAFVWFLYGVSLFVLHADDPAERKKGRNAIIGGIIGLAVMMSLWGLVAILTNTFGFSAVIPLLPTEGGGDTGGILDRTGTDEFIDIESFAQ